jgi:hypothetical protein
MDHNEQDLNTFSGLLEQNDTFYAGILPQHLNRSRAASRIQNIEREDESLRIPHEDLKIIEKIYHKRYENVGRKRGALLRYINEMRTTQEPDLTQHDRFIGVIKGHQRDYTDSIF